MHVPYLPLALVVLLAPLPAEEAIDHEVIARIKMEGLQRSQVMETLFRLTEVHGPRLHGSKNYEKAALWSRDRLREWGVDSSQLESWPSPVREEKLPRKPLPLPRSTGN